MKPTRFVTMALLLVLLDISPTGSDELSPESKQRQKASGISDVSLGLSKTSVFEVVGPAAMPENTSEPGEEPVPRRPTAIWPPVIPHAIEEFTPITRDDNLCLECHFIEEQEEGDPTPIPASHFVDVRNSPGMASEDLYKARWVCVSCHVSQTRAEPLVGNSAHPAEMPRAGRSQE